MNKYQPITAIHSSAFDKIVKSFTLFFMLTTIAISIALDILHGFINTKSNILDYVDQQSIFNPISNNLAAPPIKQIYFRDLYCDTSEETLQLFPYADQNITRWNNQLLCITRYQYIRYSTSCDNHTEYNCGPYCLAQSEGTQCPISRINIVINDSPDEDADQNLDSNRDLYITRDNGTYGIATFEVVIKGYPCYNTRIRVTANLNQTNDFSDCDSYGQDTDNSVRIEQTTLKNFVSQSTIEIPNTYQETAIAYLTERVKLTTLADSFCTEINTQLIQDVLDFAESVDEIGLVYLIIKSIFEGLIFIIFIVELILLKGRAINDLRIISVLLKTLIICLMSFIMIQGGLVLYQNQRKLDVELYYQNRAECYNSKQIQNLFLNFPNLFSDDLLTFVQLQTLALIIIGIMEAILGCLFLVQMFHWCFRERKTHAKQTRNYSENLQVYSQQTDPYLQQFSPKSVVNNNPQVFLKEQIPPIYLQQQMQLQQIQQQQQQQYQQQQQQQYQQQQLQQSQQNGSQNSQNSIRIQNIPQNQQYQSNSKPLQNSQNLQQSIQNNLRADNYDNAQPRFVESYEPKQIDNVPSVIIGKKNSKY